MMKCHAHSRRHFLANTLAMSSFVSVQSHPTLANRNVEKGEYPFSEGRVIAIPDDHEYLPIDWSFHEPSATTMDLEKYCMLMLMANRLARYYALEHLRDEWARTSLRQEAVSVSALSPHVRWVSNFQGNSTVSTDGQATDWWLLIRRGGMHWDGAPGPTYCLIGNIQSSPLSKPSSQRQKAHRIQQQLLSGSSNSDCEALTQMTRQEAARCLNEKLTAGANSLMKCFHLSSKA